MWCLSFAKGWKAFQSPFVGHMVTQIFVLCVGNAENSPMVVSGLGGSLRLQILFPETSPLPITSHYVSNTTLLQHGWYTQVLFAMALQEPGETLVLLGKSLCSRNFPRSDDKSSPWRHPPDRFGKLYSIKVGSDQHVLKNILISIKFFINLGVLEAFFKWFSVLG